MREQARQPFWKGTQLPAQVARTEGSNYGEDQGRIWQTWLSGAVAVLLGAAVMIAIFGLAPLDPRYQGWLYQAWPRGALPIRFSPGSAGPISVTPRG